MSTVRLWQVCTDKHKRSSSPRWPPAAAVNIFAHHEGFTIKNSAIFYASYLASKHWPLKYSSEKGVVPCEGELTSEKKNKAIKAVVTDRGGEGGEWILNTIHISFPPRDSYGITVFFISNHWCCMSVSLIPFLIWVTQCDMSNDN